MDLKLISVLLSINTAGFLANYGIIIAILVVVALVLYGGFWLVSTLMGATKAAYSQSTSYSPQQPLVPSNVPVLTQLTANVTVYENDFSVTSAGYSLVPSTLNFSAGTFVNLRIVNLGIMPHGFKVFGNGLNQSLEGYISPGENATMSFRLVKIGNYTMFSNRPGDQDLGMNGTIHVN